MATPFSVSLRQGSKRVISTTKCKQKWVALPDGDKDNYQSIWRNNHQCVEQEVNKILPMQQIQPCLKPIVSFLESVNSSRGNSTHLSTISGKRHPAWPWATLTKTKSCKLHLMTVSWGRVRERLVHQTPPAGQMRADRHLGATSQLLVRAGAEASEGI